MNRNLFLILLILYGCGGTKQKHEKKQNYKIKMCGVKYFNGDNDDNDAGAELEVNKFNIYKPLLWKRNLIRVYFKDINDKETIKKTLSVANLWTIGTRIKFVQADDETYSDIRVCFKAGNGYLSEIGTLAQDHPFETTMYLDNLDKESNDEFRRVVLHEFGHALGLGHEHQGPNFKINWNLDSLYAYFKREYKWSKNDVDFNVVNKLAGVTASEPDQYSIMIYAFPSTVTTDGKFVEWPYDLSSIDKVYINQFYKK